MDMEITEKSRTQSAECKQIRGRGSGTTSHSIWPVTICLGNPAPIMSEIDATTKQAKSVRPAVRTKNEQATAVIHEVARSPGHDAALLGQEFKTELRASASPRRVN